MYSDSPCTLYGAIYYESPFTLHGAYILIQPLHYNVHIFDTPFTLYGDAYFLVDPAYYVVHIFCYTLYTIWCIYSDTPCTLQGAENLNTLYSASIQIYLNV